MSLEARYVSAAGARLSLASHTLNSHYYINIQVNCSLLKLKRIFNSILTFAVLQVRLGQKWEKKMRKVEAPFHGSMVDSLARPLSPLAQLSFFFIFYLLMKNAKRERVDSANECNARVVSLECQKELERKVIPSEKSEK